MSRWKTVEWARMSQKNVLFTITFLNIEKFEEGDTSLYSRRCCRRQKILHFRENTLMMWISPTGPTCICVYRIIRICIETPYTYLHTSLLERRKLIIYLYRRERYVMYPYLSNREWQVWQGNLFFSFLFFFLLFNTAVAVPSVTEGDEMPRHFSLDDDVGAGTVPLNIIHPT